jgi:hypothetical protein
MLQLWSIAAESLSASQTANNNHMLKRLDQLVLQTYVCAGSLFGAARLRPLPYLSMSSCSSDLPPIPNHS